MSQQGAAQTGGGSMIDASFGFDEHDVGELSFFAFHLCTSRAYRISLAAPAVTAASIRRVSNCDPADKLQLTLCRTRNKVKNSPAAEPVGPSLEGRHCLFPGAEIIKRIIKQEVN